MRCSLWRNFAWMHCFQLYSNFSEISQRFFWNYEIVLICWLVLFCIPNGWLQALSFQSIFFTKPLMISEKFDYRYSILTNNRSSKSDINIVNVSPISNFYNWSACPHSLVNWFVSIPYCNIAALNAVPAVTIWSSNTVVIDRTPNKIIDICGHINLKSLSTRHFPFTVIQTVYFWITSDCERITFIANLKNKKIVWIYLETGMVKCWTIHIWKVFWESVLLLCYYVTGIRAGLL